MYSLCHLDLSGTDIKELPNSLSDLESLKTLLLGSCLGLVNIPYLGKLKALRELDLWGTAINEVPQGMEKLVNLNCLLMNGANNLMMLPTGSLLNFPNIQHHHLPYQIQTPVEDIKKLKQLEEFVGRVKDVTDFNRFIESRQSQGYSAFYFILVGEGKYYFEEATLHIDYNKVILDARGLNRREDRDVIMLAQDIRQLEFRREHLSDCLFDEFPRLNYPKFLRTLKIINCEGIECILENEQLMAADSDSPFQTIEEIVLLGLPDFVDVVNKQEIGSPRREAVFLSLRILEISYCNKMKKLNLPISELQNLEEICVMMCDKIEEIIEVADDYRSEGVLTISLPKLKCLNLNQLPRLKSICKKTMICGSIETVDLKKCPILKKLPLFFPPCSAPPHSYSNPPSLRGINLVEVEKEWWKSLEWEHPAHYHLLQPFVHFL